MRTECQRRTVKEALVLTMATIVMVINDRGAIKRYWNLYFSSVIHKIEGIVFGILCLVIMCLSVARLSASAHIRYAIDDDSKSIEVSELVAQDTAVTTLRDEAEAVAKVLYGTARYNSPEGRRLVVWCIINRVENPSYPNNVIEVCRQEQQWMGYSDDNPIMQDFYDLAYSELKSWHDGGYRTVGPEFIFMSWTNNEIALRTEFKETKNTKYIYG